MRKLTLDIENLNVQSFETAAGENGSAGTVLAREATNNVNQCGDGSIADACETGLCTFENCPYTYDSPDCTAAANGCA